MSFVRIQRCCRFLLGCITTLLVFEQTATAEPPKSRPNILMILIDDMGWRDCGFMGSDFFETPNIDRLAAQGMVFSNAYAAAANCAPSRACLLTGQTTPRHRIFNVGTGLRGNPKYSRLKHIPGTDTLDPGKATWSRLLQQAGYRTAIFGKWHLSDDPLDFGFDINVGGSHGGSPPKGYFPPHPKVPGLDSDSKDEYLTDRLTDEAVRFIRDSKEQPWLAYLSHFAVHTPLQGKPELVKKYQQKQAGELHSHAVMGAMIQSVDEGIGRLVETLEATGQRDDTVIIFTSDNGGYGPATSMAPLKGYKGTYYEGGIREPFFVVWPQQVSPGSRCDIPVSNIDLFPTICAAANVQLPESLVLDGRDIGPLLKQQVSESDQTLWRERSLFWHFPAYLQGYSRIDQQRDPIFRTRPCSIVRKGKWKLHAYYEDQAFELYDLVADPGESKNLVSEFPGKLNELRIALADWRVRVDAPIPSQPNARFDAEAEDRELQRLLKRSRPRSRNSAARKKKQAPKDD